MTYKETIKNFNNVVNNIRTILEVEPFDLTLEFSIDEHTDFIISQLTNTVDIRTYLMTIPLSDLPTISHYKTIKLSAGLIDFDFNLNGIDLFYVYTASINSNLEENYEVYADNLKDIIEISAQLMKLSDKYQDSRSEQFSGIDIEELKNKIDDAFNKKDPPTDPDTPEDSENKDDK